MSFIYPKMCFRVQDLSKKSKNTQFEVRTRKLWPREVQQRKGKVQMNSTCHDIEAEKKLHPALVCHDITVHMSRHRGLDLAIFLFFGPFLGLIS